LLFALLTPALPVRAAVSPVSTIIAQPGGGEIQAYDKFNKILIGTKDGGVEFYSLANPAAPVFLGTNDLTGVFSGTNTLGNVSSVAVDPVGRGVGVALCIPTVNDAVPGKAVFFNLATRATLRVVDVGYHPDMVTFAPDGAKVLVANEGELVSNGTVDRPGSLSVITVPYPSGPLLRITEVMSSSTAGTADWFELVNLGDAPVDLAGFRMDDNSFSFVSGVALAFGGFGGTSVLNPGESAVFTESTDIATFRATWKLPACVKVGSYGGSGVGLSSSGDGVVVFNSAGVEQHRVSFPAAISGRSFYWEYDSSGTLLTAAGGVFSTNGVNGAFASTGATPDAGSPGVVNRTDVPVPAVVTVDFQGVDLSAARINPLYQTTNAANAYLDIEPEYITVSGGKAYVTLQENNAVGVFNLATNGWEAVLSLGKINQLIDGSEKDGVRIDDVVAGLPMPDAIASFTVGGQTYLVTANEGDARDDNALLGRRTDEVRVSAANIEPGYLAQLNALYQGMITQNVTHANALGDLRITRFDGVNSSGQITNLTMYGSRSFSIYTAGGVRVFDSGSQFEQITAQRAPSYYNTDSGLPANVDRRSSRKGPEPEGVAVGEINGRIYAFIGLERAGGVFQYDVTNPTNAFFVDYLNATASPRHISPEGVQFIHATNSPTGGPLLIVGYELSSDIQILDVTTTPPVIIQGPRNTSGAVGGTASFSVEATGSNLSYQWRLSGTNLVGATNAVFTVPNVQAAGSYSVVVSTPNNGFVTSLPATLAVVPAQFVGVANHGLVGVGRVPADASDKLGTNVDTLGGIFSAGFFDQRSWFRTGTPGNYTYGGNLYGLPDRGFGDGAEDYHPRVQTLAFTITPAPTTGGGFPQTQIVMSNSATLVFTYTNASGTNTFTGFNADDGSQTNFPASTPASKGQGRRSLDPEGLVRTRDGGYWVSDEYGPMILRFDSNGVLQSSLPIPASLQPRLNGTNVFQAASTVNTSGRRPNRGLEGLSITPDGRRLFAMLQSPTIQDGGANNLSQNTRLLVYDIESGSPTQNQVIGHYLYQLTLMGTAATNRHTPVSAVFALNDHQLLVLERDGIGLGGTAGAPLYKQIILADITGATSLIGTGYDLPLGAPGQSNFPLGLTVSGVVPVARHDFVSLIDTNQLARFGLNADATRDTNSISEKWEAITLVPLNDPSAPDDHLMLVGNDNDFKAAVVYHNGVPVGTNTVAVDTMVLAWRVTLPGYEGPLVPKFRTRPAPFAGGMGTGVNLNAGVVADPAIAYQWFRDGSAIPGATNANFSLGSLQSTNVGNYQLVATTAFGSVTNTVPVAIAESGLFAGVTLDGPAGARYSLQFLDTLGATNNWQSLTNLSHPGGRQFYLDLNSPGAARRFFRAVPTP
jgi:hypothetical protein